MSRAVTIGVFATVLAGGQHIAKRINELLTADPEAPDSVLYEEPGSFDTNNNQDEFAEPIERERRA